MPDVPLIRPADRMRRSAAERRELVKSKRDEDKKIREYLKRVSREYYRLDIKEKKSTSDRMAGVISEAEQDIPREGGSRRRKPMIPGETDDS